jgi:hemolysin III
MAAVFGAETGRNIARKSAMKSVGERRVSPAELAADRLVHVIGLATGTAGAAVLVAIAAVGSRMIEVVSATVYSAGLIAMLAFSAAYNLARNSRHSELLQRFDHAAIFAMIAGTYTPFTTLGLTGNWAIGMTVAVWSIAALGITLKLTLPPRRFEGLSVVLYLVFGWLGLIAYEPLRQALGIPILALIGTGGLVYSLGVIFHGWQRLPYQNAIWHGFVLIAAAIHYAAVCGVVLAAG